MKRKRKGEKEREREREDGIAEREKNGNVAFFYRKALLFPVYAGFGSPSIELAENRIFWTHHRRSRRNLPAFIKT